MDNLKWLNSQLKNVKNKLNDLLDQKELIQSEIDKMKFSIEILENKLKQLQKEPQLSEHALLRYIERVLWIDIESIKNEIMGNKVIIDTIKNNGNGTFDIDGKFLICVKNKTITTIKLKREDQS